MTSHTVQVPTLPVAPDKLGYFRFGRLAGGIVVTNEYGEWHHFDEAGFRSFLAGDVGDDHPDAEALTAKGFLRAGLDLDQIASAMRRRKRFVGLGPSQHVLSLSDAAGKLGVDTAKDIVDFAMLSTASALEFRVLPGPMGIDLDLLGFLVQYSTEKNRYEGKALTYRLVADPAGLDDDGLRWLVDKRFRVRIPLHGSALSPQTLAAVSTLHEAAAAKKRDGWTVEVDVHVDASNVASLASIAQALAEHGLRTVRLVPVLDGERPVSPSAWAAGFRAFLSHLLAMGPDAPKELTAATIVTSATRTDAASDVSMRSPSAAGCGRVVYDTQGTIYPSEAVTGLDDPSMFALGTAGQTPYRQATTHPTLRALTVASLLECLPGFADHWAAPFLGFDPIASYAHRGDLFTPLSGSADVAVRLAAVEAVFEVLLSDADGAADVLRAWAED